MRRWLVPGVILVIAAAIVLAPARLLGWLVPASQLSADGFSGSLWRGSAARAALQTPAGPFYLGQVSWRLNPLSLLLLEPPVRIESSWGQQRLSARVGSTGGDALQLADVHFAVDAALLQQLAPVAVAGRVSGDFALLELERSAAVRGRGRLVWEQAAWEASGGRFALGSYAVDFAPETAGEGLRGDIITLAGPLTASGYLTFHATTYAVDMSLSSEGRLPPALFNALSLIAMPVGDGFRLQLNGKLPL